MGSKANGALMRITPLAVWGHKLSQHDLVEAVKSDAQLTHPNKTCLVSLVAPPTLMLNIQHQIDHSLKAVASCQLTKACLVSHVTSPTFSIRMIIASEQLPVASSLKRVW